MSTIEGGMICTNDKDIYRLARTLRSHGMAREIGDKKIERKIIKKNPKLSPQFIMCAMSSPAPDRKIELMIIKVALAK